MYHYFILAKTGTVEWIIDDENIVNIYSPTIEESEDVMSRLQQRTVEEWSIDLHSSSPDSMLVIMNNISKFAVRRLSIYNTQLDSKCVSKLSEVLYTNVKIRELSLEYSLFTGGIKQVSDALINNITLEWLWLDNIPLTDEDTSNLSTMLSINKTLNTLGLINCNITDNGVRYICVGLTKNQTLTLLNINYNPQITSASTSTIAELINTTKSLTTLDLGYTSLNNDDIKTICTSLTKNTKIRLWLLKRYEEYCNKLDSYQVIKDRLSFV